MDNFIKLSDSDKRAYFEVAADKLNVLPQFIEKDFWVCWILKNLFSLPEIGSHLTFKGGTSLSKCYDVIRRFSEDVDVSIERPFLESEETVEPDEKASNKENERRLQRLQIACKEKINTVIFPELKKSIGAVITDKDKWSLEIDSNDADGQTVLFVYPHVLGGDMESYVKSAVKIEFGARSDHFPVEEMAVTPYVDRASSDFQVDGTSVRVLAAERTFWEKATILHMIYHYKEGRNIPLRMSRHYYDFFVMINTPIYKKALEKIELLKNVAEHKALFFKANWAHYEEAKPGSLKLLPKEEQIKHLKTDYRQMQEMFFETPPSFDVILDKLKEVEAEINLNKIVM